MIETVHLGTTRYEQTWQRQLAIFEDMKEAKKLGRPIEKEYILTTQHHPVITLGFHADAANLLVAEQYLKQRDIDLFRIERGGDITYHGPGQLVVYPLVDLERHHLGVKQYVTILEQAVINVIGRYGIKGERVEGATGVWIGKGTPAERKICAVGVKCSRYVTMHGLALNVNTDLDGFSLINPCGFKEKGVTSMARELGHELDFSKVEVELSSELVSLLA